MHFDIKLNKTLRAPRGLFTLDVCFEHSADRLVIFGPSGSGKSVTLQMMAGLMRPDSGHVRLDGHTLFDTTQGIDLPARQRGFGYVFQDYALFPHMTVEQNILASISGPWPLRVTTAARARAATLMATLGLDAARHQYPSQLSGGQRQRTAVARALAPEPGLLLLDEPFAALDITLRDRLRNELLELQARLATPIVLITHDPADVEVFGEVVVTLGNSEASSSTAAVVAEYERAPQ